jgi:hypothetical protein
MKDLVIELITSYENRVTAVENLITNDQETKFESGDGLSQAYEMGQKLRADLREIMVRNRSLRRADFEICTARIFNDIESKKSKFEEERAEVRKRLKAYVGRQKELITSLKEELTECGRESSSKGNLESILNDIKTSQAEDGELTFSLLRRFQVRVKTFCQELEELNDKLKRTLERGDLIKIDDLRQLKANMAVEQRRSERKARQEDIQRLLTRYNKSR